MIRGLAASALTVLLAVAGCEGRDPVAEVQGGVGAKPPVGAPIERPELELAGCEHLVDDACHVRADAVTKLRAWIDLPAGARLQVTIDGAPIEVAATNVDGGQRLAIRLEPGAEQVEITGVDPPWTRPHALRLVPEPSPAAVVEARRLLDDDDLEAARERLEAGLERLEDRDRLEALQLLRRVLGEYDPEGLRRAEQAAELAESLGRTRDFVDAASMAAFVHLHVRGDLAAAREWTLRLEAKADALAEARVWARYYRGILAGRSGDLTTALRTLSEARRGAERMAMADELLATNEALGQVLAEVGRGQEALALVRDTLTLARAPEQPCEHQARALNNIAWANLLLAQAGLEHDPPLPLLDEVLDAVGETGACPDAETAAYARVNAALAALAEHEPDEAHALLDELQAHELPPYLEPWVDEIVAQVGLATGRWSLVPALVRTPDPGGGEPGLRFTALVRHAQTLARLGFVDAAIDSYGEAEAILEQSVSTLGIDLGRELYLAGRQASAIALVELLIGEGRANEALCRARLARGRALQSLDRAARIASLSPADLARREQLLFGYLGVRDRLAAEQREDWRYSASERDNREGRRSEKLAKAEAMLDEALRLIGEREQALGCSELPELGEGEVMLVHFPRASGSWLFVAERERVSVAALPAEHADADIEAALADAAERLRGARRIRVIPTSAAWAIPFHALRFDEGVLLDVAPVVYSLDLPRRRASSPELGRSALVIANPSDDLPHAAREAELVGEHLRAQGWTIMRREGADATRAAFAQLVDEAALLHYAGHGAHTGASGWEAALLLHEDEQLGVGDILALARVPEGVVLTGCDTATVVTDTLEGGMNLGRAFVLAGSRWVIAAEGKVDDELALRVGESLYRADADPQSLDGAHALRRVQRELRRAGTSGWQAFRVIVP